MPKEMTGGIRLELEKTSDQFRARSDHARFAVIARRESFPFSPSNRQAIVESMLIELPDDEVLPLGLKPARARVELAVGLFASRQITLGRAARIAGIPYAEFMKETSRRGISIKHTEEDAAHDIGRVRNRIMR